MPITPPMTKPQAPSTIADTSGCTTVNRPSKRAGYPVPVQPVPASGSRIPRRPAAVRHLRTVLV